MIKLAVGVQTFGEFIERQALYMAPDYHGALAYPVWTRRKPRRDAEILNGGSLYWVVKNNIALRQEVLGIEEIEDDEGQSACLIMLSPQVFETIKVRKRPFQGWRYLEASSAPRDRGVLSNTEEDNDPESLELQSDLVKAGLL